ncbi:MAG TPA: hypothetical protein VI685_22895 [Candidatus Angelobacter sp.]
MLKKILFFLFLTVVFSAVAISASQLKKKPTSVVACGSPCTLGGDICKRPCGCYIPFAGGTSGTCQPEGPPPGPLN